MYVKVGFMGYLLHGHVFLMPKMVCTTYTEQKKKRNNYIPLNLEKTMIQSEIIAFFTYA